MLKIDTSRDTLQFKDHGCQIDNWRIGIEADGKKAVFGRNFKKRSNSPLCFVVEFPGTGLVMEMEAEFRKDAGRLVLRSFIENHSRDPVKIGRVFMLDADTITGFCKPDDDVVGLALDGSTSQRRVFRLSDPKAAESGFNPRYPQRSKIKTQFYNRTRKLAMQAGFLTFHRANTEVEYEWKTRLGISRLQAWCDYAGWQLGVGKRTPNEVFTIAVGANPYRQLESWADEAARRCHARKWEDAPIGWVGWSWVDPFTVERYEDVVLRNAAAIRRRLPGFRIDYIWVSIGNLAGGNPGDWLHWNNELFPGGPEHLAAKLKELGFKWGLWCGVFYMCALSRELKKFKDTLLRNPDGTPLVVRPEWSYGEGGNLPAEKRPSIYALDPSHPKTHEYLREVFSTYRKWGVRYYMVDFLEAGAGNISRFPYQKHHDARLVAGPEAYHKTLRAVREGAGDDTYFLSSSGPSVHNAGFVDAVRTGTDFGEGRALYPDSYFYPGTFVINSAEFWTGPQCALQNQAAAYYTHRRLYINDSGNVLTVDKPLTLVQAQMHATIHAMSGGPSMIGDDVDRMDDERLNLIKITLPRPRDVAFPVDLFDQPAPETPRIFQRRIEKPWGRFDVVAVYNFSADQMKMSVTIDKFDLDPKANYLVWEFWNTEYLGRMHKELAVTVPPGGVRVYRLVRDEGYPVILGTDLHLLMGEVEVIRCDWDARKRTLSGRVERPAGEKGSVFFHVPENLRVINPKGYWIAKDGRDRTLIVRKAFDFTGAPAEWSLAVGSLPKQRERSGCDFA